MRIFPILLAIFFISPGFAQDSVYQEKIVTPHWVKHRANAGGTAKALFVVGDFARREPWELGQRYDIGVTNVRTLRGSNAYKNVWDLDDLAAGLAAGPDVLVVSANRAFRDLGELGVQRIGDWVKGGGNLLVFGRHKEDIEFKELTPYLGIAWEPQEVTGAIKTGLDLDPTHPGELVNTLQVVGMAVGEGKITYAKSFERTFSMFNAFHPRVLEWDAPEVVR